MSQRFVFRVLLLATIGAMFAIVPLPESAAANKGKKYALLVGVQEYDHAKQFKPLSFAENDVNETARELKKAGYTVILLTTSDDKNKPTLANIEKQLDALLKKATKYDLILVGLAGHGMQFDKIEDSYFCPLDARVNDTKTMLSMRSVYRKLEDSPVGVGLLLVDACRDDGGPRAAKRRGVDGDKLPSPPKGVAALFSCSSGQFAWETPAYKHGVFFHFVLEGLRGKAKNRAGSVTWNSLSDYVSEQVSGTVPELIGGGAKQEPHEMKSLAGLSPVLLDAAKEVVVKSPPKSIKNSIGMKLVYIKPGKFMMGSSKEEQDDIIAAFEKNLGTKMSQNILNIYRSEGPIHEVEITKGFYMGVYEVAQNEYKQIMGTNPSHFSKEGPGKEAVKEWDTRWFPVERVSYEDAVKFCEKLSAQGAEKGRVYRLPTEAEWEYACRAGTKTPCYMGESLSSKQANFNGNFPYGKAAKSTNLNRTSEVGSYKANAFGLYDMHGNVWEWCSDWYGEDYYSKRDRLDPKGPNKGAFRILRGGCWWNLGWVCRSATRYWDAPTSRSLNWGFRVVCSSP